MVYLYGDLCCSVPKYGNHKQPNFCVSDTKTQDPCIQKNSITIKGSSLTFLLTSWEFSIYMQAELLGELFFFMEQFRYGIPLLQRQSLPVSAPDITLPFPPATQKAQPEQWLKQKYGEGSSEGGQFLLLQFENKSFWLCLVCLCFRSEKRWLSYHSGKQCHRYSNTAPMLSHSLWSARFHVPFLTCVILSMFATHTATSALIFFKPAENCFGYILAEYMS